MGGSIAMIVRKPDGEVLPCLTTTGLMADGLADPDFLAGNFEAWWAKQQENVKPLDAMAPYGYGIAVVDFPVKTVLYAQGYRTLGAELLYKWRRMVTEDRENILQRHADGRFQTLELPLSKDDDSLDVVHVDVSKITRTQLEAAIDGIQVGNNRGQVLPLHQPIPVQAVCDLFSTAVPPGADPHACVELSEALLPFHSEWAFSRSDETALEFARIKQRMDAWGYPFAKPDVEGWWTFLSEQFEDDPTLDEAMRQVSASTPRHRL